MLGPRFVGGQPDAAAAGLGPGAVAVPLVPARLLETRVGAVTVDGCSQGVGRRLLVVTVELTVAGRGGVPADAAAVMLNVTAVSRRRPGFVTVFPCGRRVPWRRM